MHVVGDAQRRHKKGRTSAEKMFKRGNLVLLAIQLACFLIVLSQTSIAGSNTFDGNFWFPRTFQLIDVLDHKTRNCTKFNATLSVEGYSDTPLTVDHNSHGMIITRTAGEIRWCLILYLVGLGVGALNKLLFDLNFFSFYLRHMGIHKEILSGVEFVITAISLYYCVRIEGPSYFIVDYFKHCGVKDTTTLFHIAPFAAIYTGIIVIWAAHGFTLLLLLYHGALAKTIGGVAAYDTPAGQQRQLEEQMQEALEAQQAQQLAEQQAAAGIGMNAEGMVPEQAEAYQRTG